MTREEAMKGFYTKERVNEIIREEAEKYGFKTRTDERFGYGITEAVTENLNFFVEVKTNYNIEEDFVQIIGTVKARASVSRMGADTNCDELLWIADEIRRMANLVASLNAKDLVFVEIVDKREY